MNTDLEQEERGATEFMVKGTNSTQRRKDAKAQRKECLPRLAPLRLRVFALIPSPSFASAVLLFLLLFAAASLPAAEPPKRGGTLRLARVNDPTTLDPALVSSMVDVLMLPLLYQPLIDFRGGANLANHLATNWTVSPDKRVFTFQLLPGVRFSNGREATAEDYVFTLERSVLAPSFLQQYAMQIKGAAAFQAARAHEAGQLKTNPAAGQGRCIEPTHLAGVSTPSRDTLVIELEKPDTTFSYWMANSFGMAVAQESLLDPLKALGMHPIGTGPYVVKEWIRGVRLRYERNPYYFRPEQQYFDAIEVMIGGDESTHLMMFERGDLDLASLQATGAPEADFLRLHKDARWKSCWTDAPMFHCIIVNLNTEMPPLNDIRVRQAIAHALDRKKFQRMNGERVSPGHGGITPLMPGFNPELKYPAYDPERARALLREAGFAKGLPKPLKLWHINIQLYRRWAAAIQDDLAKVGFAVELHEVSGAVFDNMTGRRNGAEMSLFAWTAGTPEASFYLLPFHSRFISEESSQNGAFYHDATVDRWLDEAAVSVDEPQRLTLYRQVEQKLVSEGTLIVLGHQNLFALRQPWLKGPLLEPMWWFRLDRVWFEK